MEHFNIEAFLWTLTLILLGWLYWMRAFSRRDFSTKDSVYPHIAASESRLELQLRQAGLSPNHHGKLQYWTSKLFCASFLAIFVLLVFAIRALPPRIESLALPVIFGFFLPDIALASIRRQRIKTIRSALSFYLDLVVSLLRAGLPVHRALFKAGTDGFVDPHPLAEELARIETEIQAGKERGTAFYALADRTGVPELRTLAAAIHVSIRQGAPIEDTLEAQAEVLRERRRDDAVKRINSSAAISVLPVFLCGIPMFAVLVYFPAFLEIIETLRNLRLF